MDVTALRNCGLLFLAGGAGALARYGVSELANTLVGGSIRWGPLWSTCWAASCSG